MSEERKTPDIRAMSNHFNRPGAGTEPWLFVPKSNIAETSTAEHQGTVTIRQAGQGQDIRGILNRPIGIRDFPLPWEFQMSLVQNHMAALLGVGDLRQNNCAIGLNVALTFSDPGTWPEDRTRRPPETYDFQLLVIHLGASQGTWFFPMTLTEIDLRAYPPPWEWEVCFIPPPNPAPWNLYFSHRLEDSQGEWKTYWRPGVIYDPTTGRASFTNTVFERSSFEPNMEDYLRRSGQDSTQIGIDVKLNMVFDPEPPPEVMLSQPLHMLYQVVDTRHLRMGFRGGEDSPWYMSEVLDVSEIMEGDIAKLGETCLGIANGRHFSLPGGMPMYAQYRIDYLRFRHFLTAE